MDICLLTTGYLHPYNPNKTNQAIFHLVQEMQRQGHSIFIIYQDVSFLTFARKDNWKYIRNMSMCEYSVDGTKVTYCPIQSLIPHTTCISPFSLKRAKGNIRHFIEINGLNPDLVLVHFGTEQYPFVKWLQKEYGWNPVFVFHNADLTLPRVVKKIVASTPKIGVRSDVIRQKVCDIVGKECQTFQVYSGCPDNVLEKYTPRLCKSNKKRETHHLLYAGLFQPGKKVDIILRALSQLKDKYNFIFDIVGDGEMHSELLQLVETLDLKDRVVFHGKQPRDYVLDMMLNADCFIMVSSPETLGLVYLEALGCGCFVIGSKGEGIDGIIRDRENGLLVTPGSVDELVSALEYYFNLDETEFNRIMVAAHKTALQYTESSVARQYIQDALDVTKQIK